jgi:hypothetical protein
VVKGASMFSLKLHPWGGEDYYSLISTLTSSIKKLVALELFSFPVKVITTFEPL